MKKDPIVEEIHKFREELLKENNNSIEEYLDFLKQNEKKHKNRLISGKRPQTTKV